MYDLDEFEDIHKEYEVDTLENRPGILDNHWYKITILFTLLCAAWIYYMSTQFRLAETKEELMSQLYLTLIGVGMQLAIIITTIVINIKVHTKRTK